MDIDWNLKFIKEKCYSLDNDRFKKKSFVYAPFPEIDKHGFQDGEIREIILGDILSRFLRMENENVLYPVGFNSITLKSFLESKKLYKVLDHTMEDIFYNQMSNLGIGISNEKCISMRGEEYIGILQNAFIELYERGYIKYKIYNPSYERNNELYEAIDEASMPKAGAKCFILDIDGLIPQIASDIEKLSIEEEYKNELIGKLSPVSLLKVDFFLSNGKALEIEMENPEYMGGISYIFLNPNFMDIDSYISQDEKESVYEFINSDTTLYAYSGLSAKNPLTGRDIPVFISKMYHERIYLGIPSIDSEDALFVLNEGFDSIDIIASDGTLMNSDLLDGYERYEAREKIIEAFTESLIGTVSHEYKNHEILLSSLDPFGALFPFLEEENKINSLKEYLPYLFSSQFRPVLSIDVLVSGSPISGTMSSFIKEGLCPLLSLIYDDIGSIESLFSLDTKELYESFLPIKKAYIPKDKITESLLMPIVFYNIIKKEVSYALPDLFQNVSIVSGCMDIHHSLIRRSNHNLMDMDKYIHKFGCDAIRFLVSSSKNNEELLYDTYYLEDLKSYLMDVKRCLMGAKEVDSLSLDYYFHKLSDMTKEALDKGDIYSYLEILKAFNKNILFKENISKNQAFTYIRIIYPLFPCLAEEVYMELFNGKYSILNEGWPS